MKKVSVLIVALLIIFTGIVQAEVDLPKHMEEFYVNDFANILSNEVKENIIEKNLWYENTEVQPQIVVATVQNLSGLDIETFAVELFEKWKIGNEYYDNGVLILISLEEQKIRIEVGYGLEGAIVDAEAGRIIDSGLKDFVEGNYDLAVRTIFFGIVDELDEEYGESGFEEGKTQKSSSKLVELFMELPLTAKIVIILIITILIVLDFVLFEGNITLLILRIIASGGSSGKGSKGGGGRSGGGGSSR